MKWVSKLGVGMAVFGASVGVASPTGRDLAAQLRVDQDFSETSSRIDAVAQLSLDAEDLSLLGEFLTNPRSRLGNMRSDSPLRLQLALRLGESCSRSTDASIRASCLRIFIAALKNPGTGTYALGLAEALVGLDGRSAADDLGEVLRSPTVSATTKGVILKTLRAKRVFSSIVSDASLQLTGDPNTGLELRFQCLAYRDQLNGTNLAELPQFCDLTARIGVAFHLRSEVLTYLSGHPGPHPELAEYLKVEVEGVWITDEARRAVADWLVINAAPATARVRALASPGVLHCRSAVAAQGASAASVATPVETP